MGLAQEYVKCRNKSEIEVSTNVSMLLLNTGD